MGEKINDAQLDDVLARGEGDVDETNWHDETHVRKMLR